MTVDPYSPKIKATCQQVAVKVAGELAVTEAELSLFAILLDEIAQEKPVLPPKKGPYGHRAKKGQGRGG